MASGKKNYFRHSFFARNDEFVCELIDKFGLSGYYYYFALIEMCGEQSSDDLQKKYKFHKRTLVNNLRLNSRKLNLFLTYLQDKSKISCTLNENQYEIIFPNLSKYLGKYTTKTESNTSNKKKEKEKKENKSVGVEGLYKIRSEFLVKNLNEEEEYVLSRVKPKHQEAWIKEYEVSYLLDVIFNAHNYYKEKLTKLKFEKKIWVSTINSWIKRDNNSVKRILTDKELGEKFTWLQE